MALTLQITVKDKNSTDPLAGVTFELIDSYGNVVGEKTSDENGLLIFKRLRAGTYKLR